MSDFHFKPVYGPHLSREELELAAGLLSRSYTSWQHNPKNRNPVTTDTSPAVYAKAMSNQSHEVLLYYEGDCLCAVFVHALSPDYDRYPLRKLSYLGLSPLQKGFEPLKSIFSRYAAFVKEQGEDVLITSDLDQATLNSLLEAVGFCEVIDRNETFFLLSQMLRRRIFSFQKVRGDFVIDQIIKLDGKAVRRDKKLYKLQTTPYDFYALYLDQQSKRIHRSIAPENLRILGSSLSRSEQGLLFISSFDGTITNENETQGGFNATEALMGADFTAVMSEVVDSEKGLLYLLPGSEDELRCIADKVQFRPGFYDFLFFSLKILSSFYITSAAPLFHIQQALDRALAPTIPLRYIDLIESLIAPQFEVLPGVTKIASDNTLRTAYRCSGPFADLTAGSYAVKKDLMLSSILDAGCASPVPVIYLCSDIRDKAAIEKLFAESQSRQLPVLVFDFGGDVTLWASKELQGKEGAPNPFFSIITIRDFYQIPVMLHEIGLKRGDDTDFLAQEGVY